MTQNSNQHTGEGGYFHRASKDHRDELIKKFMPLVKRVVHRLASRLPVEVDVKEMLNSGIIGLVDALEKYDPAHETNFSTYAQFRIRGEILDSFRSQDWAPRSLRHKAHRLESAYRRIEQELGRPAEDHEVAKLLGIDEEELQRLLGEVSSVIMLSFEELGFGHGEERFIAEEWIACSRPDPLDRFVGTERIELIARALDRMPHKERLVLTLYFFEELNLKEIGEIINVTESRASQIRSRALIRLKTYLKNAVRE